MKANKFFLGLALIGAILTGCEKDPVQTGDYDSKSYMSVSIAQASGTRAGTDGGFLQGTSDENQITSIDFYFWIIVLFSLFLLLVFPLVRPHSQLLHLQTFLHFSQPQDPSS